jgi:hypothetical protein
MSRSNDCCVPCVNVQARLQQAGNLSMSSLLISILLASGIEEQTLQKSQRGRNFKRPRASIGVMQVELSPREWFRGSSVLRFIETDQ